MGRTWWARGFVTKGRRHRGGSAAVALTAMAALNLASHVRAESFDLTEPSGSVLVRDSDPLGWSSQDGYAVDGSVDGSGETGFLATDGSPTGVMCTDEGGLCGGSCTDADMSSMFSKACGLLHNRSACWVGRADALILWRNAPPDRLIVQSGDDFGDPILDANQLDSTAAAGPRVSLIRRDKCSGNAWEATYLRAANFRSQRYLPFSDDFAYALAPPGIYDNNDSQPFDEGYANLGSRLQSFEFNRLIADGQRLRWLAGFRWVEWQENFSLSDTNYELDPPINDLYQTDTINSLYGGQIGAELLVLTLPWLRVDSVVKAGAYYNNAVQRSSYTTNEFDLAGETVSVRVGDSPASCGFIGEVGMTGAIPITSCLDFRFGYFALWLSGIAQPTQQLSGQQLVPDETESGSLATNGGVVVQGVTLGLEGRW
jgi:hypothetical protein